MEIPGGQEGLKPKCHPWRGYGHFICINMNLYLQIFFFHFFLCINMNLYFLCINMNKGFFLSSSQEQSSFA